MDAEGLRGAGAAEGPARRRRSTSFGRTEERRTERALIGEYRASIDELLAGLDAQRLALAVEIARIPEEIRGYGHVKARHLAAARVKWEALMARWRDAGGERVAA